MVNLDDFTTDPAEMFKWHARYHRGLKADRLELFGRTGKGTVRACKDLANYASNKGAAMGCRARGDIPTAQMYEGICQRIYAGLPDYARW